MFWHLKTDHTDLDRFEDREEHTPQEVRAGLTEYMSLGYVASDLHSESGSRTLDYACESSAFPPRAPLMRLDDDYAASVVASFIGADNDSAQLLKRAKSYTNIWNVETGFMEARTSNGAWAGEKT